MNSATKKISEEQAVNLVRNALLVAGTEMGAEGDHWPVINSTVHDIMRNWEQSKIERNVDAELKTHLYAQLEIMERETAIASEQVKAEVGPQLKDLRELYDAYFSELGEADAVISENEKPLYLKRAKTIVDTLEDEDVG